MRTHLEHSVDLGADADDVWRRAATPAGINHEMKPWVTMTLPRGAAGLTIDTITLGRPIGRAWLRLWGVLPFDYDRLVLVEREPGQGFLEQSTMFSMRRWEHERTITPVDGGTRVHDRIAFEPRLVLRPIAPLLTIGVRAFFRHRHQRLKAHWGPLNLLQARPWAD